MSRVAQWYCEAGSKLSSSIDLSLPHTNRLLDLCLLTSQHRLYVRDLLTLCCDSQCILVGTVLTGRRWCVL